MRGRPPIIGDCIVEIYHEDQVLRSEPMSYHKAVKAADKFTRKGIKARVREVPSDRNVRKMPGAARQGVPGKQE